MRSVITLHRQAIPRLIWRVQQESRKLRLVSRSFDVLSFGGCSGSLNAATERSTSDSRGEHSFIQNSDCKFMLLFRKVHEFSVRAHPEEPTSQLQSGAPYTSREIFIPLKSFYDDG